MSQYISFQQAIAQDGFCTIENIFTDEEVAAMLAMIQSADTSGDTLPQDQAVAAAAFAVGGINVSARGGFGLAGFGFTFFVVQVYFRQHIKIQKAVYDEYEQCKLID